MKLTIQLRPSAMGARLSARSSSCPAVPEKGVPANVCGRMILFSLPSDPYVEVKGAEVNPAVLRKGVGTKLYEKAARWACAEHGKPLASDSARSSFSEGFWQKQVAKGRAKPVVDRFGLKHFVLTCPAPSLEGLRRRRRRSR